MQSDKQNKDKIKGVVGTILFHAAIVILLLVLGFTTPLPLPGDEGVEVNLGSSDMGFGQEQPDKPAVVTKFTPPPKAVEKAEEEVVTQDTEDAPFVEETKEEVVAEKPVEKVEEKEVKKEEPVVNPAAMYKGKNTTETQSSNEGVAGGEGDQGAPGGSKDATEYLGKGGFGDGTNWSLAGRVPTFLPKPSRTFSENGTVAVQITVNKYGKVIKAVAIDKGSNTTNSQLRKLAEQAALKAEFNVKLSAAEMQRGTITYNFIIKN